MARFKFDKASLNGRFGEFVGATRYGVNYVRTYVKPRDPRRPEQLKARAVFGHVAHWANALNRMGICACLPVDSSKTGRGAVYKGNQAMFSSKIFDAEKLQAGPANFSPVAVSSFAASGSVSGCSISLTHEWKPGLKFSFLTAHFVAYNWKRGAACKHVPVPLAGRKNRAGLSEMGFDLPPGYRKDGCRIYFFITGTDAAGNKKFLSETFSAALE